MLTLIQHVQTCWSHHYFVSSSETGSTNCKSLKNSLPDGPGEKAKPSQYAAKEPTIWGKIYTWESGELCGLIFKWTNNISCSGNMTSQCGKAETVFDQDIWPLAVKNTKCTSHCDEFWIQKFLHISCSSGVMVLIFVSSHMAFTLVCCFSSQGSWCQCVQREKCRCSVSKVRNMRVSVYARFISLAAVLIRVQISLCKCVCCCTNNKHARERRDCSCHPNAIDSKTRKVCICVQMQPGARQWHRWTIQQWRWCWLKRFHWETSWWPNSKANKHTDCGQPVCHQFTRQSGIYYR